MREEEARGKKRGKTEEKQQRDGSHLPVFFQRHGPSSQVAVKQVLTRLVAYLSAAKAAKECKTGRGGPLPSLHGPLHAQIRKSA